MESGGHLLAARGSTRPLLSAADVVGREAELAAIEGLLSHPADGPGALLLEGEPGIGKTTLWQVGLERGRELSHRVLSCRPAETEAALPFSALGDLLEPVLDEALPRLPEPQRLALEVALQRVAPPEDPTDRFAVSLAVLAILRDRANGTTTLALDDIQWVDPSTADVLAFALRRVDAGPLLLLLSRRGGPDAPLPLGLKHGFPVRRLRVGPLTVDELDRLLAARLEPQLPRPQLMRLHGASGGNPYFALEILRASEGSTLLEWGAVLPVPESLAALLRRRIDGLSTAATDVVMLASASPHATPALLKTVTASNEGIAEALEHGILELDGERLRFTHPLLASVAYGETDPVARREAHRRLATAVDDPDDRALHLALATERADEEVAAELERAASRAHRRGAPAAAAELADHARRLTPEDQPEDLLARTAQSAEYHLASGDTARGRELLEHVVDSRPPGPERARLLLRLGRVRYASDDLPAAHRLFGQALAEGSEDLRLSAEAEQALAFTAIGGGDIPLAIAYARSALELAERLGDRGLLALALGRVAQTEVMAGKGLDRAALERAVQLERDLAPDPVEWLPSYVYAWAAAFTDDLETARNLLEGLHRSATERGDERALPSLLIPMSIGERAAGNLGSAGRYAVEAVERSRQVGLATPQSMALAEHAFVSALVGRVDIARAAAEEGVRIGREAGVLVPVSMNMAALGFLELSLDDPASAHRHLGPLSEAIAAMGLAEPGFVRFLPDEIEALVALGELEAAGEPLRLLEERGRALDRVSALAAAGRCRALLEATRGDFDAARASLVEALAQHERLGQPFELGRTLLAQGSIERRFHHRAEARATLTRALELFDELGAPLWAEKASAELARIPGRVRASLELTETERRVAELVAEGLSNKEVAARLFVTVRTVEANLTKIYGKLGIRSRTELASRIRS
jgi:DNA-binding CsgD family transcriptional regulator